MFNKAIQCGGAGHEARTVKLQASRPACPYLLKSDNHGRGFCATTSIHYVKDRPHKKCQLDPIGIKQPIEIFWDNL